MPTTAVKTEESAEVRVDFSRVDESLIDPMTLSESATVDEAVSALSGDSAFMSSFVAAFDEVDAAPDEVSADGRLTGQQAGLLSLLIDGEWQVKTAKEGMTFDTALVACAEVLSEDAEPPSWYTSATVHLGDYGQIGSTTVRFFSDVLVGVDGMAALAGHHDGQVGYFLIDYHAPRPYTDSEQQESKFLADDGSTTMQYYLYKYVEGASAFINFFSPADNIIQGATGRNLDVFDAENYGETLEVSERTLQFIQAAAECVQLKGLGGAKTGATLAQQQLHKAGQVALAIAAASSTVGPVAVDILETEGVISPAMAGVARVVLALGGLADTFVKFRGGEALKLGDYFNSLVTLQGAGEEAIKAVLGEDGYEEFWVKNTGLIGELTKNSKNIHDAVALLVDAYTVMVK